MSLREREYVFEPTADGDSPVADVIELNSRKWTRAIVERLLVNGSLRYSELGGEIDGISDKVLSDSLEELQAYGLVERTVIEDRPVKVEYSLTPAGAALEDVIAAVDEWTDTYVAELDRDGTGDGSPDPRASGSTEARW
jgi:DNA-binding HxlR family transcriptional regulator